MRIKCSTLFDITRTNLNNRRRFLDQEPDSELQFKINQQTNFETLLQIISMRSQPEDITDPVQSTVNLSGKHEWGKKYPNTKNVPCWNFSFTIHHSAVFKKDENELGNLLDDCESVPMITGLGEWSGLGPRLHTDPEFKNIIFSVLP